MHHLVPGSKCPECGQRIFEYEWGLSGWQRELLCSRHTCAFNTSFWERMRELDEKEADETWTDENGTRHYY